MLISSQNEFIAGPPAGEHWWPCHLCMSPNLRPIVPRFSLQHNLQQLCSISSCQPLQQSSRDHSSYTSGQNTATVGPQPFLFYMTVVLPYGSCCAKKGTVPVMAPGCPLQQAIQGSPKTNFWCQRFTKAKNLAPLHSFQDLYNIRS